MDGPHVQVPLAKLREVVDDANAVQALLQKGLEEMVERYQLVNEDRSSRLPELKVALSAELTKALEGELKKFNPRAPYPPAAANTMCLQVVLPIKGKVGFVGYESVIKV